MTKIAVCILAKDEAGTIGPALDALAQQSFIDSDDDVAVHVVANGCNDNTAEVAGQHRHLFDGMQGTRLVVHDLPQSGKSRSWNRTVHELVDEDVDYFVFMDADIRLLSKTAIEDMISGLKSRPEIDAYTGYPIKDIAVKQHKSLMDRFSLSISRDTRFTGAINGSLYAARGDALRAIWLPNDTPGEDGFLNAMVRTRGFSQEAGPHIGAASDPTHCFSAHDAHGFLSHERRMIVGTMVNRWIFEHLWSLKLEGPAGPLIAKWNAEQPSWVEDLIRRQTANRIWVIPNAILFGRLRSNSQRLNWKRILRLPLAVAATVLTIPPAIAANKALRQRGASSVW